MANVPADKFFTKTFLLSLTITSLLPLLSGAQEVFFKQGLAVQGVSRYGREAIYKDQLTYQLYQGTMQQPRAGNIFGRNEKGEDVRWESVTADSLNRLRMGSGGFGGGPVGYFHLTYESNASRTALLNIRGNSGLFFNGEPHAGDPYNAGWLQIPVQLRKGSNELYVRGGQITASLSFPEKKVFIGIGDPTMPSAVLSHDNSNLLGAVVIMNMTGKPLQGLHLKARLDGNETASPLPSIPAMSSRKVPFRFNAASAKARGQMPLSLSLWDGTRPIDEKEFALDIVGPTESRSETFTSTMDGSVQYYAVTPQTGGPRNGQALFLSVHGAGVEAIGQARAYRPKDWGTLVAATNRRPRGFNWEDWGRLDALEVLEIAKEKFKPDPQRIYLTGHSMGGHGTWFLGATYPDKWAAIAPCAGYPTLKGYGSADGLIPDSARSPIEQVILRASNQSDVLKLLPNFKPLGIHVLHGDADKVVSVNYARQMRKALGEFHADLSYYEYPGGEHWYGDQSVDWEPLFEFFRWHRRLPDSAIHRIDFVTANPGISSSHRWVSLLQQQHALDHSRLDVTRDVRNGTIAGNTSNARLLQFDLSDFGPAKELRIMLDGSRPLKFTTRNDHDRLLMKRTDDGWMPAEAPSPSEKSPARYGTFKDPFNHRMVFVYSTGGTKQENEWSLQKARLDAETWYYRGNGSVDIIPDRDYSLKAYAGRNVILFGNASMNRAWHLLLADCPIQVRRNEVRAGEQAFQGDDLAVYLTWPIKGSDIHSVGVIGGSGLKGMGAALGNQYFAGASGFPDFMIFGIDMLKNGSAGIRAAGYFDHAWRLSADDMVVRQGN